MTRAFDDAGPRSATVLENMPFRAASLLQCTLRDCEEPGGIDSSEAVKTGLLCDDQKMGVRFSRDPREFKAFRVLKPKNHPQILLRRRENESSVPMSSIRMSSLRMPPEPGRFSASRPRVEKEV